MSFFDKAKQAATEMAAKADQAMANAGLAGGTGGLSAGGSREADGVLRDYGLIMWRETHGQPVDPGDRERVLGVLQGLESAGALTQLQVNTGRQAGGSLFGGPTPTAPPPPPGVAQQASAGSSGTGSWDQAPPPPPPTGSAPPPPPPPAAPQPPGESGGGTAPPPPPPSWSSGS